MSSGTEDGQVPSWCTWTVCGCSVTGSSHLKRGLGCDDAFSYAVVEDFFVGAVADGAGSVTGTSAWGAFAACQSVIADAVRADFVRRFRTATVEDAESLMRWLFDGVLEQLETQADTLGLDIDQLATTLAVAVARPGLAVFAQIGDGVIVHDDGGQIATALIEDKNEYANVTWFVQSRDAFTSSFRVTARKDVEAIALSTDGMSYKITNVATGEAFVPFFKGAWANVQAGKSSADLAAVLRGIEDDQTGDDKTMVLATLGRWVDEFHPSARPIQTIVVSSPTPAPLTSARPSRPDVA